MNKKEIRDDLRKLMLKVCNNVESQFVHPKEDGLEFPYITITFGRTEFQGKRKGMVTVDLVGYVKGNKADLFDKMVNLEAGMIAQLQTYTGTFEDMDSTNIFKPFGMDGIISAPYAGTRIEIQVPIEFK